MNRPILKAILFLSGSVVLTMAEPSKTADPGAPPAGAIACESAVVDSPDFKCSDHSRPTWRNDYPFPQMEFSVKTDTKPYRTGFVAQLSEFRELTLRDQLAQSLNFQKSLNSPMIDLIFEVKTPENKLIVIKENRSIYHQIYQGGIIASITTDPFVYFEKIIVPTAELLRSVHQKGLAMVAWEFGGSISQQKIPFTMASGYCIQKLGEPLLKCQMDPLLLDPSALEGDSGRQVDVALDYYALGVYTYRILHQNLNPFPGTDEVTILSAKKKGTYKFAERSPAGLAFFIAFCLQNDRAQRVNEENIERILYALKNFRNTLILEKELVISTETDPETIPEFQQAIKALGLLGELKKTGEPGQPQELRAQETTPKLPKWLWLALAGGAGVVLVLVSYLCCRPQEKGPGGRPKDPVIPDLEVSSKTRPALEERIGDGQITVAE